MKRVSQTCVYFLISSIVSVFAESAPENLFKNNQEIILKSGLHRLGDYYFGSARVKSKTNSTSSRLGAISESKLLAKARFVDYLFSSLDFGRISSKDLQKDIIKAAKIWWKPKREIFLQNTIVIHKSFQDGIATAVLAVPADSLSVLRVPSFEEIRKNLIDIALVKGVKVNPYLLLELADENEVNKALLFLASQTRDKYSSSNMEAFILGKPLGDLTKGWTKRVSWDPMDLEDLTNETLLKILLVRPYDPQVSVKLADSFKRRGYVRCQKLFEERSKAITYYPKKNSQNDSSPAWASLRFPSPKSIPIELENKLNSMLGSVAGELAEEGYCRLIELSKGTLPLLTISKTEDQFFKLGMEIYFSNNLDLDQSTELFIKSLNINITSDGCNMLGACYLHNRQPIRSISFFDRQC